jgi:Rad3-related DNA helicase
MGIDMEIQISVRNLVEFVLRSGNIDNRKARMPDNAMQEGGRIHRMIQRRMGSDYHAEVFLRYLIQEEGYVIKIEGRADGILIQGEGGITIDEIKGTYREVSRLKEAAQVHLAQAKCYAFIYGTQQGLSHIKVRITYCNIDTEEIRYFYFEYELDELAQWFEELLAGYRRWADFQYTWQQKRQCSIREMTFPFTYRDGQKDLVTYVYQTIYHKRKLFIEAPTGVGKTISTLFPAVKAMGEGMGEKIFYFTAKTITRTVADDTLEIMRGRGLKLKSVILTAKEKICFMEDVQCNPDYCPYARGHYDRINEAVYDLLIHVDNFTRENIELYARKHQVCPFEMCLDMSLFSDAVICDYNYLFDPHVYLKRFFAEGIREDYVFLIDEAHNLVERGREMYSAVLVKEDFLALKRAVKDYDNKMYRQLERCNKELLELKRECEDYVCESEAAIAPFVRNLNRLSTVMSDYLEENENSPVKEQILDFYFDISHFLLMNDDLDGDYVIYTQMESDGRFCIRLFCVNPARKLRECMLRGRSTILFSATLLPIQYYKRLLGGDKEDYEVYARSVFDPERKGLFIASDVTSRYTRRSVSEYDNIAAYIWKIIGGRNGNYMVFFPSHAFLQNIYEAFVRLFAAQEVECLLQEEIMSEQEREDFLARFAQERREKTLVGFCVLGGIFSEGIDLKKDSLIGAVVVGTGLPMVCNEREILKRYFEEQGEDGFAYAYRYPGMNKVLQAAGRVIRTVDDVGIVALLDERFLAPSYRRLFPREWNDFERVRLSQVEDSVENFWGKWERL